MSSPRSSQMSARPLVATLLRGVAALAMVIGCAGDRVTPERSGGGPAQVVHVDKPDAGADAAAPDGGGVADAPADRAGDKGTGGSGDARMDVASDGRADGAPEAGGGDGGADRGGDNAAACNACRMQNCGSENSDYKLYYDVCYLPAAPAADLQCDIAGSGTERAADGPARGQLKTELCQAVLACMTTSGCLANGDPSECYCGIGVLYQTCIGQFEPAGPCVTVMQRALETTEKGKIFSRFTSPCFAGGGAVNLGSGCDLDFCAGPCLGMSSTGGGGAGGAGGSGGSTGAGGSGGSGGGAGTGGSGGAGSGGGGGVGGGGSGGGSGGGGGGAGGGGSGGGGGGGGVGGGGSGGSAGAGGSGGAGGAVFVGCPDLDANSVLDCRETLVANPGFDTAATGWTPEAGVSQARRAPDGSGNTQSGSLAVTLETVAPGASMIEGASTQCVAVTGGASYDLLSQIFIRSGQGYASASIELAYFPAAGCAGAASGVFWGPLLGTVDSWIKVSARADVPGGVASASVRLVAQKPASAAPVEVSFDNVLLRRR